MAVETANQLTAEMGGFSDRQLLASRMKKQNYHRTVLDLRSVREVSVCNKRATTRMRNLTNKRQTARCFRNRSEQTRVPREDGEAEQSHAADEQRPNQHPETNSVANKGENGAGSEKHFSRVPELNCRRGARHTRRFPVALLRQRECNQPGQRSEAGAQEQQMAHSAGKACGLSAECFALRKCIADLTASVAVTINARSMAPTAVSPLNSSTRQFKGKVPAHCRQAVGKLPARFAPLPVAACLLLLSVRRRARCASYSGGQTRRYQ